MPTKIYDSEVIHLINGSPVRLVPLKIAYLREFMDAFDLVKSAKDDEEAITFLSGCAAIAMKQYFPDIATQEDLENSVSLPAVYRILDVAAGIKVSEDREDSVKDQAEESAHSWSNLDLAKLEAEAFLLGIWKDFEELERSVSMPELVAILDAAREKDYSEKKFLAALQGVDIDKESGSQNAWERMKAKHFSGGKTDNPNDITAFQGANAKKAGFGLGMGLGYEDLTKT